MRVIAGIAKGRQLKVMEGKNTRPTTDKVKEAVFNMISPHLNGGNVLDLFAGTGGLGIEALSRGMDHGIFVDHNKVSIQIIKSNIDLCNFSDRSEVYRNDAERALKALAKREMKFNLVLLDPPYKEEILEQVIGYISNYNLVNPNGIIVAEHDFKNELPEKIENFLILKNSIYGNIGITIYQNNKN